MCSKISNRTPTHLQGYALHLVLEAHHSATLHIIGVYYPTGYTADRSHTVTAKIRDEINKYIMAVATQTKKDVAAKACNIILAGDFNAAAYASDRSEAIHTCADAAHQAFVEQIRTEHHISPTQTHDRRATFYKSHPDTKQRVAVSRIDDILTTVDGASPAPGQQTHNIDTADMHTDHDGLQWQCPYRALHMLPPPPVIDTCADTGDRRVQTPISAEDQVKLKQAMQDRLEGDLARFNAKVQQLLQQELPSDSRVIDELGAELTSLLSKGKDIALEVCATVPCTTDLGRRGIHYADRKSKRERLQARANRKALGAWMAAAAESETEAERVLEEHPQLQTILQRTQAQNRQQQYDAAKKAINAEINMIDREHATHSAQRARGWLNKLADHKQKLSNKIALGTIAKRNKVNLKVLKTAAGDVTTDPDKIVDTITHYFSKKMAAPPPTVQRDPERKRARMQSSGETSSSYPFEQQDAVDRFSLTKAQATPEGHNLADIMADEATFHKCMHTLANNKAPGPDGVANELLKALPTAGKQALHCMFQLMWETGRTPATWKHSNTVLLYKNKGSITDLKYFRQIGLENTVYKLWTRMVTIALSDYGERQQIHSNSQAGFRAKRMTAHQIELMIMSLEDAQQQRQNMYLLQIDFSEAFDTINHDKLIQIMGDLGYPAQAVKVVKDLYTGATTSVQTPYGPTAPVSINRGTIQGDSLSPYLFIIYMEPLLRWLKVGGRGYKFGCIPSYQDQVKHQMADCTYADDLNILTSSIQDMALQADKVTAYAEWANLTVNMDKSTATAALHKQQPYDPYDHKTIERQINTRLQIQGQPVKAQQPKQEFRYLGIYMTMDLNWKPQLAHTLSTLKSRLRNLASSRLTRGHKLRIIKTSMRPMVAYTFYAAPYTVEQISKLDSQLTQATKAAYRLGKGVSCAMAHEDVDAGGLGCASLMVEYNTILIQRLVRSVRADTTHGFISRAVLSAQLAQANNRGTSPVNSLQLINSSLRLKQLAAMQRSGLSLQQASVPTSLTQLPENIPVELAAAYLTPGIARLACPRLLKDIMTLASINITSMQHIINAQTGLIMPASHLDRIAKLATGGTLAQPRHKHALNRLTAFLHRMQESTVTEAAASTTEPQISYTNSASADKDMPPEMRRPSEFVLQEVLPAAAQHPLHPTAAQQALVSLLQAAAKATAAGAAAGQEAVRIDLTKKKRKNEIDTTLTTADIRSRLGNAPMTCDTINQRAAARQGDSPDCKLTAIEMFKSLPTPTERRAGAHDSHRDTRLLLLSEIAGGQERIADVLHLVQSTSQPLGSRPQAAGAKRHKVQPAKTTQMQAMVQWQNTVVQGWVVGLSQQLGYHATAKTTLTVDEVASLIPQKCEYCVLGPALSETAQAASVECICDACGRVYHDCCMPRAEKQRWDAAMADNTEYVCRHCTEHAHTPETMPEELKWFKVSWEPRLEPLDSLADMIDDATINTKLQSLLYNRTRPRSASLAAPIGSSARPEERYTALALTNEQQQGLPTDKVYAVTHGQKIRTKLEVHPEPINPHVDIGATGACEICIRQVLHRARGKNEEKTMACINRPTGQGAYTLTPARLQYLYGRFEQTKLHQPAMVQRVRPASFAEEVFKLMTRHEQAADNSSHWMLPAAIHGVVRTHTAATKDRFVSPLNAHPAYAECWSEQQRDKLFGFRHDAFTSQWTGSSIAAPPSHPAQVVKALRHAIMSAATAADGGQAVLTTMFIPAWTETEKSEHHALIMSNPHMCRQIMVIPAQQCRVLAPAAKQLNCSEHLIKAPFPAMLVVEVGNEPGFALHSVHRSPAVKQAYLQEMHAAFNSLLPKSARRISADDMRKYEAAVPQLTNRDDMTPISSSFRRLPADSASTRHHPAAWYAMHAVSQHQLPQRYSSAPQLLHDWQKFAYTDGSAINPDTEHATRLQGAPLIGSGLYAHARAATNAPADARSELTCRLQPAPAAQSFDNTINRAELVPIREALERGYTRIATDSLASMYQIQTMAHRPQEMHEHRHRDLLADIVSLIEKSPTPVHIYKVKSHIGIVGNERADELATSVAAGKTEGELRDMQSNNRAQQCWLYLPGRLQPNGTVSRPQPVPDMDQTLKRHCHSQYKLGSADTSTIYFSAARAIAPQVDQKASNRFMTMKTVTAREATNALKLRTGNLYSNKLARRYGHSLNSKCPLCKQEDGGSHIASGCPKLHKAYTERHHAAGTMILKAVRAGSRGTTVIQADVGSQEKQARSGLSPLPNDIPVKYLAAKKRDRATALADESRSRPDFTLYSEQQAEGAATRTFTLVEIKYCTDTRPQDQLERATAQHQGLLQRLKQSAPNTEAKLVVILLGSAGYIYRTHTKEQLQGLGVTGPLLKSLMTNLHVQAIKSLTQIVNIRRRAADIKPSRPKKPPDD
jgi:ribonuclease HI